MKKCTSILACLLGFLFLLGADQASKYLAVRFLKGTPGIPVIPGVFELYYLENDGAAFGMLEEIQAVFILAALLILGVCAWVCHRCPQEKRYRALKALCVVIGAGAAGNMLDRFLHGWVIDFLYVSLIDFPVFNLADCFICAGIALLAVLLLTYYKDDSFSFLLPKGKEDRRKGGGNHDEANR